LPCIAVALLKNNSNNKSICIALWGPKMQRHWLVNLDLLYYAKLTHLSNLIEVNETYKPT